jgi:putative ABC transport system permease protein
VVEVALALMLLAGAGLLGRSFWTLRQVDPGFQPDHVITMRTTLPASRYGTDDRIRSFSRQLLDRIGSLPGVRAVGSVSYLPLNRFGAAALFDIDGRPGRGPDDRLASWFSVAGGRYFEAMGIPLLRGRLPDARDTERTTPVFVIDDELARRHWPDEDPIGARLTWQRQNGGTLSGEIIGVVGSVRWRSLDSDPPGSAYWWAPQVPVAEISIVARTTGGPEVVAGAIADQVMDLDPLQPVADVRALQDLVATNLARPRLTLLLLASFAGAALLLAAIGLYAVMAFSVAQRTPETGHAGGSEG